MDPVTQIVLSSFALMQKAFDIWQQKQQGVIHTPADLQQINSEIASNTKLLEDLHSKSQ